MAQDIISRLKVIIGADPKQFVSGIQKGQMALTRFQKNINTFSRIAGAAFAGISIGRFGADLLELNGKLRGVKIGFDALNRPNLLNNLRNATKGTVADLELMRQAVRAGNFQIPIEKLAGAFEFARKRAAATGEDVDYLVNSIIDGIGRKSSLVLDNLGISASQLQEEMKKTGDFATAAFNLIEQGAADMPAALDDAVKATDRLKTAWENFKTSAADSEVFTKINEALLSIFPDPNKPKLTNEEFFRYWASGGKDDARRLKTFGGTTTDSEAFADIFGEEFANDPNGTIQKAGEKAAENLGKGIKKSPAIGEAFFKAVDLANARLRVAEIQQFGTNLGPGARVGDSLGFNALQNPLRTGGLEFLKGELPEKIEKVALQDIPALNQGIVDLGNLTGIAAQGFTALFDTIINGAGNARSILGSLVGVVGGVVGAIAGGPLGFSIGSSIGGSLGGFVTRGGDIKHSGALVNRNRRFSG